MAEEIGDRQTTDVSSLPHANGTGPPGARTSSANDEPKPPGAPGAPLSSSEGADADGAVVESNGTIEPPGTEKSPPGPSADEAADQTAEPVAAAVPAPRRTPRRWLPRQVKWTITVVVLFFVAEYILLPEIASARRSINQINHINVFGLVLAVLLEGASLAAYAQLTHAVLSPGAPRRLVLWRVNMSSLAVSHVLPGGTAPGTALAYRLLSDQEVPGSTAALGLATQGVGSALVLNAIFWLALLISIPLNGYNPLYGYAAILGVILIGLFATVVYLLTQGKNRAAERLHKVAEHIPFVNPDRVSSLTQKVADRLEVLLRNRRLLRRAVLWASANWLLDAASLWVFVLSFGHLVSPIDLLVAYGLANILAVIPITPGGLGVVEITITATLTGFGVPGRIAAVSVLAWRLVNFWLPIPVGGGSYFSLRFGPQARRRRAAKEAPGAA